MTKQPEGGKTPNDKSSKPGKPGVKSDTFSQVTDKDSANVKGGRMGSGRTTLNPTGSDGCCGG